MSPTPADERIARLLADRLVKEFAPRLIVWFGSRAHGLGRPDSDWDLLVVADSTDTLGERLYRARCATGDVQVPKDILVVTPAEHDRFRTVKSSVVHAAQQTGRVLHEAV